MSETTNQLPNAISEVRKEETPTVYKLESKLPWKKLIGLLIALFLMISFLLTPMGNGLTPVGHSFLSVLIFMIVVWITEAFSYASSSMILILLMALVIGFTPVNGHITSTTKALTLALSGFDTGQWILVVSALIIAAAMGTTGLAQRIGLSILYIVGTSMKRVFIGLILMAYLFSFIIPAQAAVAVVMTAICAGIMKEYNIEKKSNIAKGMLLIVAQGASIAGLGILTSGAPPLEASRFIHLSTNHTISWISWLAYGLPFSVVISLVLFFLIMWMFPPEIKGLEGGRGIIRDKLNNMGPMPAKEKRLLAVVSITIILWATSTIQPIDNSTAAVLAVGAILFPGIGVVTWDEIVKTISWGTVMLFGAAISLGTNLLNTGAAAWVAKNTIGQFGFEHLPIWITLIIVAFFFGIFSLGFSARTAAVSALVPTVIGFAQHLNIPGINVWGFSLIIYYAVQFTAIVPVNDPMAIIAYGTDTFSVKDMLKLSIPMVLISMLLIGVFSLTYWHWIGVL